MQEAPTAFGQRRTELMPSPPDYPQTDRLKSKSYGSTRIACGFGAHGWARVVSCAWQNVILSGYLHRYIGRDFERRSIRGDPKP